MHPGLVKLVGSQQNVIVLEQNTILALLKQESERQPVGFKLQLFKK